MSLGWGSGLPQLFDLLFQGTNHILSLTVFLVDLPLQFFDGCFVGRQLRLGIDQCLLMHIEALLDLHNAHTQYATLVPHLLTCPFVSSSFCSLLASSSASSTAPRTLIIPSVLLTVLSLSEELLWLVLPLPFLFFSFFPFFFFFFFFLFYVSFSSFSSASSPSPFPFKSGARSPHAS